MIVQTLFQHEGRLAPGEVEIKLLPGIPLLHVVGQPTPQIKECGIKIKSAVRSCDLNWPKGNQIVVNLRPAHFKKSGSGVDLAIALGYLALTGQLHESVAAKLEGAVVYGEVALNGDAFAPPDLASALRAVSGQLITGRSGKMLRDGSWLELARLNSPELSEFSRRFDWKSFWREPEFPNEMEFHPRAAEALYLSAGAGLNVLVAGPQGTGKTTWAKALYALSESPDAREAGELEDLFGEEALGPRWRPLENPHHSITPLAMIGGGSPLFPGVISRAHGGVLIMDEFLQFHPQVLEALREPIESGYIEHARRGEKRRFPARFQLVGTTNLCPCGRLDPRARKSGGIECGFGRMRCRGVMERLSGPIADRFDVIFLSHEWTRRGDRVSFQEVRKNLAAIRAHRDRRQATSEPTPDWAEASGYNYRRRRSLLRVARGLADIRLSKTVREEDLHAAAALAVTPLRAIHEVFA